MKVPFCDFIQKVSQALSMCISMWIKSEQIISKIPYRNSKIPMNIYKDWKAKLESAYSFILKYFKIKVWA